GAVQLRGARRKRLNESEVGGVRFLLAHAFDEALEVGVGVGPGVALVRHVRLEQRYRCRFAAARRQVFDGAGERDAVLEMRHFREEAADFELGVHPRPDAPEALEEEALAERDRGVGALRMQRTHRKADDLLARELGELRARRKAQRAVRALELTLLADRL